MNSRVATVMLACFVAVDIFLVALALRPPRIEPTGQGSTSLSTNTPVPSPSPTTTGTSTSPGPSPLRLLIAGFDADTAWRGTVGACKSGGAAIQMTRDGGRTWIDAEPPVAMVVRIQPLENTSGFIVGADADCLAQQFTTADSGKTWSDGEALAVGWARRPGKPTEVISPKRPSSRPCGDTVVLDLSRTSAAQAEALCANGDIKVTNDGGTTWSDSGEALGGLALSNRLEAGVLSSYVARIHPSCKGVQVVKVVKGKDASPLGCASVAVPREAGMVAISATAGGGWLVVGDATFTAAADLKAWRRA